jgi:hypothetical protein
VAGQSRAGLSQRRGLNVPVSGAIEMAGDEVADIVVVIHDQDTFGRGGVRSHVASHSGLSVLRALHRQTGDKQIQSGCSWLLV